MFVSFRESRREAGRDMKRFELLITLLFVVDLDRQSMFLEGGSW